MIEKCANPACPSTFDYRQKGKFFRFLQENGSGAPAGSQLEPQGHTHGAEHYWLCERCARVLTLVYVQGSGVILKARWTDLQPEPSSKRTTAA